MANFFNFNKNFVFKDSYANNNRTTLLHQDPEGDSPPIILSVNMPDVEIADDEVCIKDYSENAGVLFDLINAGIVSQPVRYIMSGFVKIPVCKCYL